MAVLIGAVVIVGALCLLDLLLTFGVIRRLREHTKLLARSQPAGVDVIGLPAGTAPPGIPRDRRRRRSGAGAVRAPRGRLLLDLVLNLPETSTAFIDYVRGHPVGRDEVLAVVVGQTAEAVPYMADLTDVARVCTQADGALGSSFAVRGFPAFFVLDAGGTVLWSGYDPAALPAPAAV